MTDDLLKRLDFASFKIFFEVKAAVDRIEKLEAALREIAGNGNATGCNPQIMCDIARKALDAE